MIEIDMLLDFNALQDHRTPERGGRRLRLHPRIVRVFLGSLGGGLCFVLGGGRWGREPGLQPLHPGRTRSNAIVRSRNLLGMCGGSDMASAHFKALLQAKRIASKCTKLMPKYILHMPR